MARMLDAREDFLYELVRQGGNPNELRPGDCGCGDVVDAIEALRWENKR